MAARVIDDTKLNNIAVAIQTKDNGGQMTVDDMPTRIANIPAGSTLIPKTITENGVYNASSDNADGYSSVEVNVADKFAGLIDNTISGEVVIPDGVIVVKNKFYGCNLITGVIFPSSVITIEPSAFARCTNLENIVLSDGISAIGKWAFEECNIKKLFIPTVYNWLYAIRNAATVITKGSWDLYVNDLLTNRVEIPDNIGNEVPNSSFCCCKSITDVILPSNIDTLNDRSFYACISLTAINLQHIKTIGRSCFAGCAFQNLKLYSNLLTIGTWAFENCTSIQHIDCTELTYSGTTANTVLGNGAFNETTCPIEFADETTMNVYKNATNWSVYASRMTYTGA